MMMSAAAPQHAFPPWCVAMPAKLVRAAHLAVGARHVTAASVLFDRRGALGAAMHAGGAEEVLVQRQLLVLSFLELAAGAAGVGRAVLIGRGATGISQRVLFDASIPVLPEFEKEAGFVF